ncbi:nitrous oxide reductase accessory protein NosL [Falsochrobactrum sp. TDYN1]|uniref:Nitrous oxide reductase accessory protein NosL n=1 Tax=Falsochrobactrum tianjinense TaxID=2706015 RepID=A0A949UUU4_9HYPH|nr:nitrous oxide reductase accessory protein NosL [Falsochrobactrum sp. TDYN1]MBV2143671.1 nitrous oxide reductase accessory protein NosL [Falsochrobactrum sp. TDYN1]
MKGSLFFASAFLVLTLAGCSQEQKQEIVVPFALTDSAMGRYCGMNVLEHPGPKGQIILQPANEPVWFSSARDAIAFTMLPEEPKGIAAVYVSDMAKAANWEEPGAENWVDARKAYFVIESDAVGGMGAQEAVPFSTREAAEQFAAGKGGRIVGFDEMPREYVLGDQAASQDGSSIEESHAH